MESNKIRERRGKEIDTRKLLRYVRIIVYILLGLGMLILKYTNIVIGTCHINENFGILCPSCGITRATIAILNFNFKLAIERNSYFTLVLFPIFIILFVDDIVCIVIKKKSFVEVILGF